MFENVKNRKNQAGGVDGAGLAAGDVFAGEDTNTVRKMLTQIQRRFNTILTCAFAPDMFYYPP